MFNMNIIINFEEYALLYITKSEENRICAYIATSDWIAYSITIYIVSLYGF